MRSAAAARSAGVSDHAVGKLGERGVEPGGQLDIQQLFAAAAQMQSQLMSAQQQLADTEVQGTAGGGLVTVTINGQGELVDVVIAPAAIDPADPAETAQTLADLVLAACRAAYGAIADLQEEMMGPLASGLGDPAGLAGLPGMPDIPGLSGLPGAPGQPGTSRLAGPADTGSTDDAPDPDGS